MKFQVLVPQYKETDEVVKPLLDSIAIQQNVPFSEVGVVICNDGSNVFLSDELLKSYPFKIDVVEPLFNKKNDPYTACLVAATADTVMYWGEEEEQWKDIKGYEGIYKISTYGRVYSQRRGKNLGGFIRPSLSTSGYVGVVLCKNGKQHTYQVHRLVANHFLGNKDNLPEVNHKDEHKTNNYIGNLEFCDRIYNQNYGTAIERMVKAKNYKESSIKSALHHDYDAISRKRAYPVIQMDLDGNFIKRWDSMRDINRELGFNRRNICSACNGKLAKIYGYKWKYEERA
jgi:cellulose synthase/poly-beta-1,6-N-acetylglucosamine synthase-like glycosyltransferase